MNRPRLSRTRYTAFSLLLAPLLGGCAAGHVSNASPAWTVLFDGRSLGNWTPKIVGYPVGQDPVDTFRVRSGILAVSYDRYGGRLDGRMGHLYYKTPFAAFHLKLEYRFVGEQLDADPRPKVPVNSGVMFFSQSPESVLLEQPFPISVEAQLLGSLVGDPDRTTGNVCTPGTNIRKDGQQVAEHCLNSSEPARAKGEWVKFDLEVTPDGHITQSINGKIVMAYDAVTLDPEGAPNHYFPETTALIEAAGGRLDLDGGYIALQSEGHPVEFRDIRIRQLP